MQCCQHAAALDLALATPSLACCTNIPGKTVENWSLNCECRTNYIINNMMNNYSPHIVINLSIFVCLLTVFEQHRYIEMTHFSSSSSSVLCVSVWVFSGCENFLPPSKQHACEGDRELQMGRRCQLITTWFRKQTTGLRGSNSPHIQSRSAALQLYADMSRDEAAKVKYFHSHSFSEILSAVYSLRNLHTTNNHF